MRATKTTLPLIASIILMLALWSIIKNSEDSDRPDPVFLSTDLYFQVSELVISVPVVAMRDIFIPPSNINPLPIFRSSGPFGTPRWFATREYKAALLEFAADPAQPAEVASIKLNFEYYGSYGEYSISQEICPKLSRQLSQMACRNPLRNELVGLPTDIYISTISGLNQFRNHSFSSGPDISVFDLIEAMTPISNVAKMACAGDQKFCYAAILVSKGLYAVWSPSCSNSTNEDCKNELEAQGAEIENFVSDELHVE